MLGYFGGSYPLAVAAYNAGPGNVNKWIRANGDPRGAASEMVDWIEAIPIFETRNMCSACSKMRWCTTRFATANAARRRRSELLSRQTNPG